MTLLDYFAGKALVGLVEAYHAATSGRDYTFSELATMSYVYGAAMLKEREKHL